MNPEKHDSDAYEESPLDVLGRFLVEQVRDTTIAYADKVIRGEMKDPHSKRIHATLMANSVELSALHELIPTIVDGTIGCLLGMIDQEDNIDIAINPQSDTPVFAKAMSDGLCGELYTQHGWIAKFSNQRTME
jgi:hypothetical protein